MKKQTFEDMFAEVGRTVDEALKSYEEASTHRIVLKKGDKVITEIPAPLERAQKIFKEVSETFNEVTETVGSKAKQVLRSVSELHVEVVPIKKKKRKAKKKITKKKKRKVKTKT